MEALEILQGLPRKPPLPVGAPGLQRAGSARSRIPPTLAAMPVEERVRPHSRRQKGAVRGREIRSDQPMLEQHLLSRLVLAKVGGEVVLLRVLLPNAVKRLRIGVYQTTGQAAVQTQFMRRPVTLAIGGTASRALAQTPVALPVRHLPPLHASRPTPPVPASGVSLGARPMSALPTSSRYVAAKHSVEILPVSVASPFEGRLRGKPPIAGTSSSSSSV
jgi:hypothetical protein